LGSIKKQKSTVIKGKRFIAIKDVQQNFSRSDFGQHSFLSLPLLSDAYFYLQSLNFIFFSSPLSSVYLLLFFFILNKL